MSETNEVESIDYLSQYLTDRRRGLIDKVLGMRTRHLTVALEDIYKPQNASAVLRSCECLGIQDIHVIENNHLYDVNPDVVKGASKWLTITKYPKSDTNNTELCFNQLRAKGYRIVAADPAGSKSIDELNIDRPLALVFGTEFKGLSEFAKSNVDEFISIPMFGFTESYNLSVSAAICLRTLTNKLRSSPVDWHLSSTEVNSLKLMWYKSHLRDAEGLLNRHFMEKEGKR